MFLTYLIWLLLAWFYVVYLSCSGLHHIGGHAMLTLNTFDTTSLPLPPLVPQQLHHISYANGMSCSLALVNQLVPISIMYHHRGFSAVNICMFACLILGSVSISHDDCYVFRASVPCTSTCCHGRVVWLQAVQY